MATGHHIAIWVHSCVFPHVTWLSDQAFPVLHCRSQASDWADHPLGQDAQGHVASIITTTAADAGAWWRRLLAPWTCVHRPAAEFTNWRLGGLTYFTLPSPRLAEYTASCCSSFASLFSFHVLSVGKPTFAATSFFAVDIMELRLRLVLLTSLAIHTFAYSIPALSGFLPALRASHTQKPLRETLDDWIEREERIALDKLLANVKPGGRNVEGKGQRVADGTVVASPSTGNPDYWFQCKELSRRDLGMKTDFYRGSRRSYYYKYSCRSIRRRTSFESVLPFHNPQCLRSAANEDPALQ